MGENISALCASADNGNARYWFEKSLHSTFGKAFNFRGKGKSKVPSSSSVPLLLWLLFWFV